MKDIRKTAASGNIASCLFCIIQSDLKAVIAYSSVVHINFIVLFLTIENGRHFVPVATIVQSHLHDGDHLKSPYSQKSYDKKNTQKIEKKTPQRPVVGRKKITSQKTKNG